MNITDEILREANKILPDAATHPAHYYKVAVDNHTFIIFVKQRLYPLGYQWIYSWCE